METSQYARDRQLAIVDSLKSIEYSYKNLLVEGIK
jgi:hypothetical protein